MIRITNRSRRAVVIVLAGEGVHCYTGRDGRHIVPSVTLMPGASSDPLPDSVESLDQVSGMLRNGTLRLSRIPVSKSDATNIAKKGKRGKGR